MDKLAVIDVDSDMFLFATSFEKYQIAEFEGPLFNGLACCCEQFGRAWNFSVKYVAIGYVNKAGAVDA